MRVFILSFILALTSITLNASETHSCSLKLTKDSPLLVSDATDMGKRDYENFRETMIPRGDNVSHFITKRSIVKLLRPIGRGESYANVEVLGEAKVNEARAKGHYAENAVNKRLPQAMRGQKGFIHKNSLQNSDNYVFVVAKDSQFVALPSPYDTASAFRLAKRGSEYKVNRCCADESDSESCYDYPLFEVLLSGSWQSTEDDNLLNSQIYCSVTTSTRPVEKDQYQAVLNILKHPGLGLSAGFLPGDRTQGQADDLYFVDGRGLVMLPHVLARTGTNLTEGPYGSYHYTGGGEDIQGDDAYLAPYAACGFMAVMREWNRRYPDCAGKGCGISWGNCSHSTHVAGVGRKWPSRTHGHGHCIDIRLFTKTSTSVSTAVGSSIYNRNRIVEFLQLSRAAGATTIYLEDAQAARQVHRQRGSGFPPVLTRVPPHKDHMHVCFSHRSTDARSSFADPLAPATNSRLKQLCQTDGNDALAGKPSKLLSTDVVATAGVKTPDFVAPIPRPRPRPERENENENETVTIAEVTPTAAPAAEEASVVIPENVPTPVPRPPRRTQTSEVVDTNPPIEITTPEVAEVAEPVEVVEVEDAETIPKTLLPEPGPEQAEVSIPELVTEIEAAEEQTLSTPEDIPVPAERPMDQEIIITEVVPDVEDDPFKLETPEEVSDIIREEMKQEELSAQEIEKYYGEDQAEIDTQLSDKMSEGDYVENKPNELVIDQTELAPAETSADRSFTPYRDIPNVSSNDRNDSSDNREVRRPAQRPRSDVEQAIDGAYEPITSTDKSSGGGFLWSFFNGIWSFLANLFSFLG